MVDLLLLLLLASYHARCFEEYKLNCNPIGDVACAQFPYILVYLILRGGTKYRVAKIADRKIHTTPQICQITWDKY